MTCSVAKTEEMDRIWSPQMCVNPLPHLGKKKIAKTLLLPEVSTHLLPETLPVFLIQCVIMLGLDTAGSLCFPALNTYLVFSDWSS